MKNRKKHRNRGKEIYRHGKTEVVSQGNLARREQLLRYAKNFGWMAVVFLSHEEALEKLLKIVRWIEKLF